jgi:hypothetical protein
LRCQARPQSFFRRPSHDASTDCTLSYARALPGAPALPFRRAFYGCATGVQVVRLSGPKDQAPPPCPSSLRQDCRPYELRAEMCAGFRLQNEDPEQSLWAKMALYEGRPVPFKWDRMAHSPASRGEC